MEKVFVIMAAMPAMTNTAIVPKAMAAIINMLPC